MPKVEFFSFSSAEAIISTMETDLIRSSLEYREELTNEWISVKPVLEKYADLFSPELLCQDQFLSYYAQVCTRCFGYGLPYTSMIPMADALNHSD